MLFRPSNSVQVRELNQLQTIVQEQIERFGDNIFKKGTIVDGCSFNFIESYPYAKLLDVDEDWAPVDPSSFVGMFARNSANLQSFIIDHQDGFEASSPDLKTIYFNYVNSGDNQNTFSYSPGQILTIFDPRIGVHSIKVNSPGVGFSNTDRMVVVPAVVVNTSAGTFSNGDYVTQEATGANLQIYWVDDTTLATSGQVILGLRPRLVDLANGSSNTLAWSVANAEPIRTSTNSAAGTVENVIGRNLSGIVRTDGIGRVNEIVISSRGYGYSNTPFVTIHSPGNDGGLGSLQLEARNYAARVTISSTGNSVGNGYAFSVGEGIVYSRGYFLRVAPQTVIISKYDQNPDGVVVGFSVDEEIITSSQDTSLLDNVSGPHSGGPGADRLKLSPRLEVLNKESISPESNFFTLVGWSEGKAYRQNPRTIYSVIGDEMARRTWEESGDYVIDPFHITTKSPSNNELQASKVDVMIDPGQAYVSGYRVQTLKNFTFKIDTARDVHSVTNKPTNLEYGNWINVKEVAGLFQHSTGDVIKLYDTPREYISGRSANSSMTPAGDEIGQARIRNMIPITGTPGSADAIWRLYLFDIRMNPGKNFKAVRGIFYDGDFKGLADPVLQLDPTTEQMVCLIGEPSSSSLLFPLGTESIRSVDSATYAYRTIFQDTVTSNAGITTKSLLSSPNEFFTRVGTLDDDSMRRIFVVPIGGELRSSNTLTGNISLSSTSANATGDGTSFISELKAGDFIHLTGNSTENVIRQVVSVVNNTLVVLDSNSSFSNATSEGRRTFPQNVPVPFGRREGLSANVSSNGNILTLDWGTEFLGTADITTAIGVNIERRNVSPGTKTAARNRYVKIDISNHDDGVKGPWCLGIPDAFRLKGVWLGSDSSVDENSTDVTEDFYIDTNQGKDYLGLSYLYLNPKSTLSLSGSDWLLVKFDHFIVGSPGFFVTSSYVSSNTDQIIEVDSRPLANLGSDINSHEIPEVHTSDGRTYDLRAVADFRPIVANTVSSVTNMGSAPVNPSETISFGNTSSSANDKKFPFPNAPMTADITSWKGRIDIVVVGKDGEISVLKGSSGITVDSTSVPTTPRNSMFLGTIIVPPYPNLPIRPSEQLKDVLVMRRVNEKLERQRLQNRTVTVSDSNFSTQSRRFTMARIGQMERRIESLERQVSLTQLEMAVNGLTIPSSVDPSEDRFKFGFVVDSFDNAGGLQVDDPQFSALVLNTDLVPRLSMWNHINDFGSIKSPYIDHPLVDQNHATYTPIEGETDCIEEGAITSNYLIRFQTSESDKGRSGYAFGDYIDAAQVTVSNTATPMALYFHAYSQPDYIAVYQGNTIVANTEGAVSLDDDDLAKITNTPELKPWFGDIDPDDHPLEIVNVRFARGLGKITWNHDPEEGRTYTIITAKGVNSGLWRWAFEYPIGSGMLNCPTLPSPKPIVYNGVMVKYSAPPSSGGGGSGSSRPQSTPINNPDYLDYIDLLYVNTLGRLPDAAGKEYWATQYQNSDAQTFWNDFVFEASKENSSRTGASTAWSTPAPLSSGVASYIDAARTTNPTTNHTAQSVAPHLRSPTAGTVTTGPTPSPSPPPSPPPAPPAPANPPSRTRATQSFPDGYNYWDRP